MHWLGVMIFKEPRRRSHDQSCVNCGVCDFGITQADKQYIILYVHIIYIRTYLQLMVQKSHLQPPGMVLKPCKEWDNLPFPQLVSLPDFWLPSTGIMLGQSLGIVPYIPLEPSLS